VYFERNDYDPTTGSTAQTRLQDFKGATSISSNQYLGKPELEDEDAGQGTSYGSVQGSGYLTAEGLEVTALDAFTRVVNSQEVQSLGEGLRKARLKALALTLTLGSMLTWVLVIELPCSFELRSVNNDVERRVVQNMVLYFRFFLFVLE
jgi:hypothetical protein